MIIYYFNLQTTSSGKYLCFCPLDCKITMIIQSNYLYCQHFSKITLASFAFNCAAFLTQLAASVPFTRALVMSKVFLFFCEVFKQISSCFSIRSSAKFRWQFLQDIRSSRGFGAKTDLRAGVDPPAGPLKLLSEKRI